MLRTHKFSIRCDAAPKEKAYRYDSEELARRSSRAVPGACRTHAWSGPGGDWSGAAGGRGCDGLAHHHCPELVRSIDGSTADHAVRHPVCASRRVGAPAAGTEDGQQYGGVVEGEPGRSHL